MIHLGNIFNSFGFVEYQEGDNVVVDNDSFKKSERKYGRVIEVRTSENQEYSTMVSIKYNSNGEEDIGNSNIRLRRANLLERLTNFHTSMSVQQSQ